MNKIMNEIIAIAIAYVGAYHAFMIGFENQKTYPEWLVPFMLAVIIILQLRDENE